MHHNTPIAIATQAHTQGHLLLMNNAPAAGQIFPSGQAHSSTSLYPSFLEGGTRKFTTTSPLLIEI